MKNEILDPNVLFGEAYGIDWEHIPDSEDIRVSPSGIQFLLSTVGSVPQTKEERELRQHVQFNFTCHRCGRESYQSARASYCKEAEMNGWTVRGKELLCFTCSATT